MLFADLVGFTPLSALLTARESFAVLTEVFTYFDGVIEATGVEKVRTVGNGYYLVSGVPKARADHAHALAATALKMMKFAQHSDSPLLKNLQLRMGIHSGSVIAGVIGNNKFQFDLWGDTVKTASRMESHGEPNRIQISEQSYELIKGQFYCEPRGEIRIKGKPTMRTWFLLGHK